MMLSQLLRLLTFMQIRTRQQHTADAGGKRPCHDVVAVAGKLRAGQIDPNIKHAILHMKTALTGGHRLLFCAFGVVFVALVAAKTPLADVEPREEQADFKQAVHRDRQQCLREHIRRRQQHPDHKRTH